MLKIFNDNYENLSPINPTYKSMAIFNVEDAKLAFEYANIGFVFALNEDTGKFGICNSVYEVEKFYNPDYSKFYIDKPNVCIHNTDGKCNYHIEITDVINEELIKSIKNCKMSDDLTPFKNNNENE